MTQRNGMFSFVGIVRKTSLETWNRNRLDIVDTTWVFVLLVVIYSYQITWQVYALTAVARRTKTSKKSPLVNPPILPTPVLYCYVIGLAGVIGWLVLRDTPNLERWSMVVLAGSIVFLCVSIAMCLHAAAKYAVKLQSEGYGREVWALRILAHNGIALMTTWVVTLTMLTMAHLLDMYGYVSRDIAQYLAVGVIMAYLALWCSMDVFLTHHVTDYVVTPYMLTIVIFIMSFTRNFSEKNLHFSISAIFLTISSILLLLKLAVALGRAWYKGKSSKFASHDFSKVSKADLNTAESQITVSSISQHKKFPAAKINSRSHMNLPAL